MNLNKIGLRKKKLLNYLILLLKLQVRLLVNSSFRVKLKQLNLTDKILNSILPKIRMKK